MGAVDVERQKPNVFRMKLLGAKVNAVTSGAQHAEGRHERGAARLGHQRARHLLHHRHGRGPASLSGHGARLPVGDRQRGARADAGGARAACPTRWSPASAAAPTPSACSTPSSTTRSVAIYGVEAGGHGLDVPQRPCASHDRRQARRAARQPHLPAAGRRRADPRGPLDLGRPRLSGRRPRALLAQGQRPRHLRRRSPTRRRSTPSSSARSSRASSRRSSRRTRWRTSTKLAPTLPKDNLLVMNMCGRGDKDIFAVAEHLGMKM